MPFHHVDYSSAAFQGLSISADMPQHLILSHTVSSEPFLRLMLYLPNDVIRSFFFKKILFTCLCLYVHACENHGASRRSRELVFSTV